MTLEEIEIAIIAPTAWELQEVYRHLANSKPIQIGPIPGSIGTIGEHPTLCCLSGKGQENTAAALTLILERSSAHWAFLVGIAGGFPDRKVHRGDIIVAHVIHSFDFGKLIGGTFRRRPEIDVHCDRLLLARAEMIASSPDQAWRAQIQVSRPDRQPHSFSTAHVDCYVASSDKVVDDPDHTFYATVAGAFPEIHAVEMEGVGAGASARLAQSERRLGFAMIRGISDEPGTPAGAGTGQRGEWKAYAAASAAAFTRSVIESLPRSAQPPQPEPDSDTRILDYQIRRAILCGLQRHAPDYLNLFGDAYAAARNGFLCADRAIGVAAHAGALLAVRIGRMRSSNAKKRTLSAQSEEHGELGMVLWNSGDEYLGQVRAKQAAGLGVYKIYGPTRDYDPNTMAFFQGDVHADRLGPLGTYRFTNGTLFAGEWIDSHPKFGFESFLDKRFPYECYFGSIGVTDDRRWLPHGNGMSVSVKTNSVTYGRFDFGRAEAGSPAFSIDY